MNDALTMAEHPWVETVVTEAPHGFAPGDWRTAKYHDGTMFYQQFPSWLEDQ